MTVVFRGGTEENPYDSRTRDDRSFDLRVKNGVDLAISGFGKGAIVMLLECLG